MLDCISVQGSMDQLPICAPFLPSRYGYKYPCVNSGFAGQHDLCELSPVPFFGAPCSDAAGQQVCFSDIAAMTSAAGGDSQGPSFKFTGTGAVGSRALSATQPGKWITEQQHSLHHQQQLEVEVEQGSGAALACHVRYDAQQESPYANCRRTSDAAGSYSHQVRRCDGPRMHWLAARQGTCGKRWLTDRT